MIGAYVLPMAALNWGKNRTEGWIFLAPVQFLFSISPFQVPHTVPLTLSDSARKARAQNWRSNIYQINLECFKVLQNCVFSIPRNSTWLLTLVVCCAQDYKTSSSFFLTDGFQSMVKNKIPTNLPCRKVIS